MYEKNSLIISTLWEINRLSKFLTFWQTMKQVDWMIRPCTLATLHCLLNLNFSYLVQ